MRYVLIRINFDFVNRCRCLNKSISVINDLYQCFTNVFLAEIRYIR